jgi:hypothetical protein
MSAREFNIELAKKMIEENTGIGTVTLKAYEFVILREAFEDLVEENKKLKGE